MAHDSTIALLPSARAEHAARSQAILWYWFAALDDSSRLHVDDEQFRACYARWYGKQPAIDAEIRERFEPDLLAVTESTWPRELDVWAARPAGLLALLVLVDQLPRNMYRGTARMYAQDPLALSIATTAIREHEEGVRLPLVRRMFLYVPLLHAENLAIQRAAVSLFSTLARDARERSPHNVEFFERALGSARRHAEVIERYGRFPHRNAILGRTSTPDEAAYLLGPDPGF